MLREENAGKEAAAEEQVNPLVKMILGSKFTTKNDPPSNSKAFV